MLEAEVCDDPDKSHDACLCIWLALLVVGRAGLTICWESPYAVRIRANRIRDLSSFRNRSNGSCKTFPSTSFCIAIMAKSSGLRPTPLSILFPYISSLELVPTNGRSHVLSRTRLHRAADDADDCEKDRVKSAKFMA